MSKRRYNQNSNVQSSIKKEIKKTAWVPLSKKDPNAPKPAGRIIDTRAAQVDIEKYNEKYDRLASEKISTETSINVHHAGDAYIRVKKGYDVLISTLAHVFYGQTDELNNIDNH